ncbi:SIS domain-containing protein [Actinomycetospora termitidis]|uniref:SIS domain-containing protein n=1 Tax=Actinomycetospora termitidis TaxID=3053470 RepID=A0ABT7M7N6_9PSEU|nr:SIS domain-containing protein [Actinomycetospora sp. Odt1-22]MDL5156694.1 SIS domain-containing protein [Actinomycetospora sp. Odt1-22]
MSSLLETELYAQPEALRSFLTTGASAAEAVRDLADGTTGVVIAARGSSDNAARYAQYLVPLVSEREVTLATPSLVTTYGASPDVWGRLVVGVSQSGTSPDIVAVLRDARERGAPTLAVTNDPSSDLAGQADLVLPLRVGEERSVAATGTYTTSLAALAVVAAGLAPEPAAASLLTDLEGTPDLVAEALEADVDDAVEVFAASWRGITVGRGVNLATAHEAALKLTELTGSLVTPFSPADLRHGPIGAVGPATPTLLVAPDEAASASVLDLCPELHDRGAPVVTIGPGLPPTPSLVSPIVAVVPAQKLAWRLALHRGVEVDAPGGLHKITRTE